MEPLLEIPRRRSAEHKQGADPQKAAWAQGAGALLLLLLLLLRNDVWFDERAGSADGGQRHRGAGLS